MEHEAEVDRLYGLPLDEFVRARDELAKSLRREGEREEADRMRALRKPTAGAWALNQAVRRRRKETDALLSAGERLRAAHEALLSGGDRSELRDAMAEERDLVAKLADSAEAIASETGKSGPALRDRVRSTLHAAALDEETRESLAAGRLTHEREAVGLGGMDEGSPRAAPKRRGRSARPAAPATPKRTGRPDPKPDASARRARQERAEELTAATRAVQDARFASDQARAAHERAADAVSATRESLREAELGEREARKLAREAERELNRRERELDRLRHKETR